MVMSFPTLRIGLLEPSWGKNTYPLVICDIAIEHDHIVDFLIKDGDFPQQTVSHYQRLNLGNVGSPELSKRLLHFFSS